MVEVNTAPACAELMEKAPMQHVFNMFDLEDKVFLRTLSKKICEKVTKTFKEVTIEFQDEAEDQREVLVCARQLKNVHKITFMNFTINQANLEMLEEIMKNNSQSIEYMHISFEGDGDESLTEKYIEVLTSAPLKSFELSVYEDGGSSDFFRKMNLTDNAWFATVKILRIYEIYDVKDKEALQNFLVKFNTINSLRTLCTEQFNPYVKFIENNKSVGELQATYTTDEPSKAALEQFIAQNDIRKLGLFGGDLNNVDLTIDPPTGSLKALKLKDMPSVKLEPFLEKLKNYQLEELSLIRLESITKEVFDQYVKPALDNSDNFQLFRFEINNDNFKKCFPSLIEVVVRHQQTLRHLSFGKTPVSTENFKDLVASIKSGQNGKLALEVVDLTHVFANEDFSFQAVVGEIAKLGTDEHYVTVWISRYQIKEPKDLQDHIRANQYKVTLLCDPKETLTKPL